MITLKLRDGREILVNPVYVRAITQYPTNKADGCYVTLGDEIVLDVSQPMEEVYELLSLGRMGFDAVVVRAFKLEDAAARVLASVGSGIGNYDRMALTVALNDLQALLK